MEVDLVLIQESKGEDSLARKNKVKLDSEYRGYITAAYRNDCVDLRNFSRPLRIADN